jgi:hypothetical protein
MRVCQDSRAEAIKKYSLIFGNSTYLEKSAGTVYLDSYRKGEFSDFTESTTEQDIQDIENLATNLTEWSSCGFAFRNAIRKFTNLKTLAFMLGKEDDKFYSDKAAIKMIRKDLNLPMGRNGDSKGPVIIIVPSDKVEIFLSRERS